MQILYASAITSWGNSFGMFILSIVLALGGLWLIIRGILDIIAAVGKKAEQKDFKAAGIGLCIALLGGLFSIWGSTQVISFFKKGQEIPHS